MFARNGPLSVHKLFASCIRRVTCMRLSDVSVIGFNTQYRTSDVAKNLGRYDSCTERTAQRKNFELILTVKWKLDISLGEHLVVNFRRSVIIVELWRPKVARPGNFVFNFSVFFLKNNFLWWKFANSVSKVYMATPIDVVVFKCRKICLTGNP